MFAMIKKVKSCLITFKGFEKIANSKIVRQISSEAFIDHFTKTQEWEWRQFTDRVSDCELRRNFENYLTCSENANG